MPLLKAKTHAHQRCIVSSSKRHLACKHLPAKCKLNSKCLDTVLLKRGLLEYSQSNALKANNRHRQLDSSNHMPQTMSTQPCGAKEADRTNMQT